MTRSGTLHRLVILGTALLTPFSGCISNKVGSPISGSQLEFSGTSIILEHNASDGDAEIVLFAKGMDEGLKSLKVSGPTGNTVFDLATQDNIVGLRVFNVESAEPGIDKVIREYPEGIYSFKGVTLSGLELHANSTLSHVLPNPPTLDVDMGTWTINWSSPFGIAGYSLELEKEGDDVDELKLTIDLPATVHDFVIPKAFRTPGQYQVGIAAHSESGNIVVVEQEFSIAH